MCNCKTPQKNAYIEWHVVIKMKTRKEMVKEERVLYGNFEICSKLPK